MYFTYLFTETILVDVVVSFLLVGVYRDNGRCGLIDIL